MERDTRQRRAIRAVFDQATDPLSPREVLELAQADVPNLGLATVYRTLKALSDADELAVVELPGEGARYEVAGLPHHHHFHCDRCGRVFDIEGCPAKRLSELLPDGFELNRHEIIFYGFCPACASTAS